MPTLLWAAVLTVSGVGDVQAGPEPELREVTVEVDGRPIRAVCTPGPRRVVFLHDDAGSAADYRAVLALLDGHVGACAYERPAADGGGAAAAARGWFELATEMAAIHRALGVERPAILVGDGLGGLYARLYAAGRGSEVAGLVLLDPDHEDLPARARRGMPDHAWAAWADARTQVNRDGIREVDLAERARRSRLPDIPVTVLTATVRPSSDGWNPRWINEAARELHGNLVAGLTRGRHVPARGASTAVHRDDPRLVVDEILRVVGLADRNRR